MKQKSTKEVSQHATKIMKNARPGLFMLKRLFNKKKEKRLKYKNAWTKNI